MFSGLTWWPWNESSENNFYSNDSDSYYQGDTTTIEDESNENSSSPSIIHRREEPETIEIDSRKFISSVTFLAGGKHIVSIDEDHKIQRWQADNGTEVGTPIRGEDGRNLAVSRDGKWVMSGAWSGRVRVWNAESHSKVAEFEGHPHGVCVVDISPDATKIATGSDKSTVCVWALSTGKQLLGPWQHDWCLAAIKFSPNGCLVATGTQQDYGNSIRIYDSQNGHLFVDIPIKVSSWLNQSIAWASDSKQLFALSPDGNINCLDVYNGSTLSKWPIHSSIDPRCIALASNGMFIAASANSSLSLWDTTTHQQIGSVIEYSHDIWSMAISGNYDLVVGGYKITLRRLWDILPTSYADLIFPERAIQRIKAEKADLEETIQFLRAQGESSNIKIACLEQTILELHHELAESQQKAGNLIQSLHTREESSNSKITHFEKTIQELRNKLATSQCAANQQKDSLNETIRLLRTNLDTQTTQTTNFTNLQKIIQELCAEIAESQRKADKEKNDLSMSIEALRSDLFARDESSNMKIAHLEATVQELRTQLGNFQDTAE